MKGEFENRLRQVIDEVQASPKPIILFIDEAHTLMGAGGAAGTGDAANLLKPALARGTLRTIAATTWAEYKKYIEKDPALTRRFQTVRSMSPTKTRAILMLRGVASTMEEASQRAGAGRGDRGGGRLSPPLHPGAAIARQSGQPDRYRLRARGHQPARGAAGGRRLPQAHRGAETEMEIIGRETSHRYRRRRRGGAKRRRTLDQERERLADLEEQTGSGRKDWSGKFWNSGKNCGRGAAPVEGTGSPLEKAAAAAKAQPHRCRHPRLHPSSRSRKESGCSLNSAHASELVALQGEHPLILPSVDAQAVASVVADWTGIPVGRMVQDEIKTVLAIGRHSGRAGHRPEACASK